MATPSNCLLYIGLESTQALLLSGSQACYDSQIQCLVAQNLNSSFAPSAPLPQRRTASLYCSRDMLSTLHQQQVFTLRTQQPGLARRALIKHAFSGTLAAHQCSTEWADAGSSGVQAAPAGDDPLLDEFSHLLQVSPLGLCIRVPCSTRPVLRACGACTICVSRGREFVPDSQKPCAEMPCKSGQTSAPGMSQPTCAGMQAGALQHLEDLLGWRELHWRATHSPIGNDLATLPVPAHPISARRQAGKASTTAMRQLGPHPRQLARARADEPPTQLRASRTALPLRASAAQAKPLPPQAAALGPSSPAGQGTHLIAAAACARPCQPAARC